MIDIISVHSAVAVAKDTSVLSSAINLTNLSNSAKLFLDLLITGDGTVTASYEVSDTENGTYISPSGATAIVATFTKTSGTSGRDIVKFETLPFINKFMKIRITETVKSNPVAVTAKLIIWDSNKN